MERFDLLVIGGGINGTAIARDASVRGYKVLLVEKDDLAQHTSSASSKLVHGGLRYLEYYEFRLVREALQEREVLLRTAPHIVRPLQFVLPHGEGMRPWWMIRAGLILYDLLARGGSLPRSRGVGRRDPARVPLKPGAATRLARYSDAWVDDARLVALNAVDAAELGAIIATRTELLAARRDGDDWTAELSDGRSVRAGAIVNAAGSWVAQLLTGRLGGAAGESKVRLVRGSHIVVPKLFEGEQAYILQQPDGRIVFAIPYEGAFTLVGTTDVPVSSPQEAEPSGAEIDYLCQAVNRYFSRQIAPADIVWCYGGIRALFDDGAEDAKAVTRDYHLELTETSGAKLLTVFGGKITTARALAEAALDRLGMEGRRSTRWRELPGGDIDQRFNDWLAATDWMPADMLRRLARAYGTRLRMLLGEAESMSDLGRHFGAGLTEREIRYLIDHEFARTADDILWRRTKAGLHMSPAERGSVEGWMGSLTRPT